ncbi:hypothetical protein pb186bvf_012585 [Paramecium bursaria]
MLKPPTPAFGEKGQRRCKSIPSSQGRDRKETLMIRKWKQLFDQQQQYYLNILRVNNIKIMDLPKFIL